MRDSLRIIALTGLVFSALAGPCASASSPAADAVQTGREATVKGPEALKRAASHFGSFTGSMQKGSTIKIGLRLYLAQGETDEADGLGIAQSWDNVTRDWHYHPKPKEKKEAWTYSRFHPQNRSHEAITPQPEQIEMQYLPASKSLVVLQKIDAGNGIRRVMIYRYEFRGDRLIYTISRTDTAGGGPVKPETRTEQMELVKETGGKKK